MRSWLDQSFDNKCSLVKEAILRFLESLIKEKREGMKGSRLKAPAQGRGIGKKSKGNPKGRRGDNRGGNNQESDPESEQEDDSDRGDSDPGSIAPASRSELETESHADGEALRGGSEEEHNEIQRSDGGAKKVRADAEEAKGDGVGSSQDTNNNGNEPEIGNEADTNKVAPRSVSVDDHDRSQGPDRAAQQARVDDEEIDDIVAVDASSRERQSELARHLQSGQAQDDSSQKANHEGNRTQSLPPIGEGNPGFNPTPSTDSQPGRHPDHPPDHPSPTNHADDRHVNVFTPDRLIADCSRITGPYPTPQSLPRSDQSNSARLPPATSIRLKNPLRLTADLIDMASLEKIRSDIFNLPDISRLNPQKQGTVRTFIESLFCPERYWDLCQNMRKVISKTGTGESENVSEDNDNISQHPVSLPNPVKSFVSTWKATEKYALETATKDVWKMISMGKQKLCYESWCRLVAIWNPRHVEEDDGVPVNNSEGSNSRNTYSLRLENPVDSKAIRELNDFFKQEFEKRRVELRLTASFENIPRTSSVLKTLVAPHLGFAVSICTNGTNELGQDEATVEFDKSWYNTMTRGKTVYVLHRYLGWGALAIVKSNQ